MKEVRWQGDNALSTFEEFADGTCEGRLFCRGVDGRWQPPLPPELITRDAARGDVLTRSPVGAIAVVTDAPPRRPHRLAPEPQLRDVPELRADATPKLTVRLNEPALDEIRTELLRDGLAILSTVETGGNLIGRVRGDVVEVIDATGPEGAPEGDGEARRMRDAVRVSLRGGYGVAAELARAYDDRSIIFAGGWHSHPRPIPEPSPTDRVSAISSLEHLRGQLGYRAPEQWVDLILYPHDRDGMEAPRVAGWVTRYEDWSGRAVTEPCNVEMP
jgi:hypothetical protein